MTESKKLLGEERRKWIVQQLEKSEFPIKGSELAKRANVSRQVIVGDITLLKAQGMAIVPTSEGYLLPVKNEKEFDRIIGCVHHPDQTEEELNLLVDHGVTVKDVTVEHPVYGQITAAIMVSNRREVKKFVNRIKRAKAAYLSELTEGFHLHTISSDDKEALDEAEQALRNAGLLVELD